MMLMTIFDGMKGERRVVVEGLCKQTGRQAGAYASDRGVGHTIHENSFHSNAIWKRRWNATAKVYSGFIAHRAGCDRFNYLRETYFLKVVFTSWIDL